MQPVLRSRKVVAVGINHEIMTYNTVNGSEEVGGLCSLCRAAAAVVVVVGMKYEIMKHNTADCSKEVVVCAASAAQQKQWW